MGAAIHVLLWLMFFLSSCGLAEDDAPEGDMPSLCHIPGTVLGDWGGQRGDPGGVADIKFIYWTKYDTELSAHTYAHAYTIRQCSTLTHRMCKAHPARRENGHGKRQRIGQSSNRHCWKLGGCWGSLMQPIFQFAGQEATVRTRHGTKNWFKTRKEVRQDYILSSCLFNLYTEYIM